MRYRQDRLVQRTERWPFGCVLGRIPTLLLSVFLVRTGVAVAGLIAARAGPDRTIASGRIAQTAAVVVGGAL